MEELYEHYATSLPPAAAANAESRRRLCGELEATEIEWSDPEALETKPCIKSFGLTLQNLHKWLLATPSSSCIQHDASETGTCMARIVLCNKELKRPWQASPAALRVVEHFDMRLAYEYARTCVSGTGKLFSRGNTTTYMLAHPKLVALWSVTRSPSPSPSPVTATVTIQAIIFASPGERARLQGLVAKPWNPSLTFHDMFPGFLCGLALSQEVDSVQEDINEAMRHVEARTGHHNSLRGREEEPAPGSWGHLSAKMSGFARKLASTNRKIMVASELLGFITANFGSDSDSGLPSSSSLEEGETETEKKGKGEKEKWKGNQLMGNHVRLISARLDMQRVQNDFLVQKVNIQLTAIFNLMARKDSSVGFQSAASMKTLALLALVFLPGNFLAALFSAPLFDWDNAREDSIGVGMKAQFKLFWVITIPLTGLAFVMYLGWSLYEKRQFDRALDEHCS